MTGKPKRLHTFLSILCVVLAGIVALVLSPLHPGWAIRLTRYVSRSMVGGRRSSKRRSGGRATRAGRRLPASKRSTANADSLPVNKTPDGTGREVETSSSDTLRGNTEVRPRNNGVRQSNLSRMPQAARQNDTKSEVQSALVNLGMKRQQAGQLSKSAIVGRDFDGALRWAIANRSM